MKKFVKGIYSLLLMISYTFSFGSEPLNKKNHTRRHSLFINITGNGNNVVTSGGAPFEKIKDNQIDVQGNDNIIKIGQENRIENPVCKPLFTHTRSLKAVAKNLSNFSWQYWVASAALLYYIPSEKRMLASTGYMLLTFYVAWPLTDE